MSISDTQAIREVTKNAEIGYFCPDPLIGDFTQRYDGEFLVSTARGRVRCDASKMDPDTLAFNLGTTIFQKGRTAITWDIKRYLSYMKKHQRFGYKPPQAHIIDLKYALAYIGRHRNKPPTGLPEALALCSDFLKDEGWRKVNAEIHIPLATEVLPAIETKGVFDLSAKGVKYSNYEIEGSANGRLTTPKLSKSFLTVHSMGPNDKAGLKPRRFDDREIHIFIEMDFVNMEVGMLQWLSNDDVLESALNGTEDFYESLFEWDATAEQQRELGKSVFLPVAYGLQPVSLAKKLKIGEGVADTLIRDIKGRFPKCFSWLDERENLLADNPIASDYLGRRRDFSEEPPYRRRNFEVQSPAATVCLEKLIQLHRALPGKLTFHIHDGYILSCQKREFMEVAKVAKETLEAESNICPGLRLKTKCKVAGNLLELKEVKPKGV